jgi:hypothetical protein
MKPEEWLKLTVVVKVRNKLGSWTRDDVIAFANQEFNSVELTKQQISELCEKLKHKKLEKPGKQFYLTASNVIGAAPAEFKLVANRGSLGWSKTHWYYTNKKASLRFASLKELLSWVFNLIEQNPRKLWHEIIQQWNYKNKINNFSEANSEGFSLDSALEKVVAKRTLLDKKTCTPLPDNANIQKQYWGLDVGDILVKQNEQIQVVEVRANLDTPPTITFKKVE